MTARSNATTEVSARIAQTTQMEGSGMANMAALALNQSIPAVSKEYAITVSFAVTEKFLIFMALVYHHNYSCAVHGD